MTATRRSNLQTFLEVQYIIIQAILGQKSMKKFTVTNEKKFWVCKTFDRKRYQWYEFEDFPPTASEKGFQYRKEDSKNKMS